MPIEWTEDLATGIADIDAQHRELYRNIAQLHEAMKQNHLDRVRATLVYLADYAVDHFATEERAMAAASYPGLEEHRAAHHAFVEQFLRYKADVDREGTSPRVVVDLSAWLGGWLRDHVRRMDGDMARHLRPRQPREP
jgi:hemerythrin